MKSSLLPLLILLSLITACKEDNSLTLDDIENLVLREYIKVETDRMIEPKIALCNGCKPQMFWQDTLAGITKFNKDRIYFNKDAKILNYIIDAYRIDFKEKNFRDEIETKKRYIFHWQFSDQASRQTFIDHMEYYNRILRKFKEESEVIVYKNQLIQNQYFNL